MRLSTRPKVADAGDHVDGVLAVLADGLEDLAAVGGAVGLARVGDRELEALPGVAEARVGGVGPVVKRGHERALGGRERAEDSDEVVGAEARGLCEVFGGGGPAVIEGEEDEGLGEGRVEVLGLVSKVGAEDAALEVVVPRELAALEAVDVKGLEARLGVLEGLGEEERGRRVFGPVAHGERDGGDLDGVAVVLGHGARGRKVVGDVSGEERVLAHAFELGDVGRAALALEDGEEDAVGVEAALEVGPGEVVDGEASEEARREVEAVVRLEDVLGPRQAEAADLAVEVRRVDVGPGPQGGVDLGVERRRERLGEVGRDAVVVDGLLERVFEDAAGPVLLLRLATRRGGEAAIEGLGLPQELLPFVFAVAVVVALGRGALDRRRRRRRRRRRE